MAKIKNCCFCGKELQHKFLQSEVKKLNINNYPIECCEECHQEQTAFLKSYPQGDRLLNKISSAGSTNNKEMADLILKYREDFNIYKQTRGHIVLDKTIDLNSKPIFWYNDDGYFWVDESVMYPDKVDLDVEQLEEEVQREMEATEEDLRPFAFDKNDITKLQYTVEYDPYEKHLLYVAIRFNDESILTCKPCLFKTTVYISGLFKKKKAKGLAAELLTEFKAVTDVDLPIEYVNHFFF